MDLTIRLFEMIFGTKYVTPKQCESVAILYGRQIYIKQAKEEAKKIVLN